VLYLLIILSHFYTPKQPARNPVAVIMVRLVKLIVHGGSNPSSPLRVIVELSQLVIQLTHTWILEPSLVVWF